MKKFRQYYLILVLLTLVSVIITFQTPPDEAVLVRYDLSPLQARFLSLTLIVPLMIIWYAAFYGFIKLKQYVAYIGQAKDAPALKIISDGLMVMAVSLPFTSILSNVRTQVEADRPDLIPTVAIVVNYLTLGIALSGTWLIAHGAQRLTKTLEKKPYSINQTVLGAAFASFCIFFTYITLTNVGSSHGDGALGSQAYYLPQFLLFATIVIPYICLWYLGLRAAYHIQLYRKNVPGVLYRRSLGYLSSGVAFVVISTMTLRLLVSLSSHLNSLTLRFLLAVLYALLIVISMGYVLIAIGAKKLKKIEDV